MKLTIESTANVVVHQGVPVRMWVGHTDAGVPVTVFTCAVVVCDPQDHDLGELDGDLDHVADIAVVAVPPHTLS